MVSEPPVKRLAAIGSGSQLREANDEALLAGETSATASGGSAVVEEQLRSLHGKGSATWLGAAETPA